ncbi:ogg1p [Saccharomyces arboricola H-6]|uniref:N-glycosylase/DNA lyase n=1 Tax=Saccharomyces arboricola (strain H-6 / AS 2.3317 / CBS 10644) TaxID=1160507 RepID=J8Q4I8_SACAR|nr:ogg1p [Saccharomyces arboricola H-6]
MSYKFGKLAVNKSELCLANVLQAGQSFRWIWDEKLNQYSTTMKIGKQQNYSVVILRQNEDKELLEFAAVGDYGGLDALKTHLMKYFRLDVSLKHLFDNVWIPNDKKFAKLSPQGIRILAQEPWETLISFICSSNNNISRITRMCNSLCSNFGNLISTINGVTYHSFPTSEELASRATEARLRELGFGYRAKYIIETARKLAKDKAVLNIACDTEYLQNLCKDTQYEDVREHIMSYNGVGPKVADCVCLMGLQMDGIVPVDVHVSRIAKRDYQIFANKNHTKELRAKYDALPITRKKINPELDYIRLLLFNKWGSYAGWAQGVLFSKEVGGTSGSTTSGEIKKRKWNMIKETEQIVTKQVKSKVELAEVHIREAKID